MRDRSCYAIFKVRFSRRSDGHKNQARPGPGSKNLLVARGATKGECGALRRLLTDPTELPTAGSRNTRFLLRKEVIQPHLPVRLPCYDFTPIIDPTLDGSLPFGLGHRLRVKPTLVV
jgi:hypothetical protein